MLCNSNGTDNNNNNTVISIAPFTDRPGALTTTDVCSTKYFSFEAALEKTSVSADMMEMAWKICLLRVSESVSR